MVLFVDLTLDNCLIPSDVGNGFGVVELVNINIKTLLYFVKGKKTLFYENWLFP